MVDRPTDYLPVVVHPRPAACDTRATQPAPHETRAPCTAAHAPDSCTALSAPLRANTPLSVAQLYTQLPHLTQPPTQPSFCGSPFLVVSPPFWSFPAFVFCVVSCPARPTLSMNSEAIESVGRAGQEAAQNTPGQTPVWPGHAGTVPGPEYPGIVPALSRQCPGTVPAVTGPSTPSRRSPTCQ